MFSPKKWLEKTVKGAVAALAAVLTGPHVAPVLCPVLEAMQTGCSPEVLAAGLFAAWLSLANFLKHQSWVPAMVRWAL